MKTADTVHAYKTRDTSNIGDYLGRVVDQMPVKVQEVFDRGRGHYCPGEIALYDALVQRGVTPMTAAQAAVSFPDPLVFHPAVECFAAPETRDRFRVQTEEGVDPLMALLNAAETTDPYVVPREEYQRRLIEFSRFVTTA